MNKRRHVVAVLLALAVLSTACTRPEGETEVGAAAPAGGATDPGAAGPAGDAGGESSGSRLDQGAFGDLENVCGEGEGGGAGAGGAEGGGAETGLTEDEVRLGTITDKGSAERPGLNEGMYDAAVAFAAWCNEHGGIGGREVVIDDLDARLFEYGQRVAEGCEQDFALVGGGGVFDSQGIEERIACGLPNFPGFTVTPAARVSGLQVQPIPNPVHEWVIAGYRWLLEANPDNNNYGILWVNLDGPATIYQQAVEAVEQIGYDLVFDEQYRPIGETGWRGFVQQMREAEVETLEVIGEPENMVALQSAMQTEGWYPEVTFLQANFIDERFGTEGAATMSDSTYARSPFPTFAMADQVPAMADYLELMERYNPDGKVAFLGAQALSAFLLFATAARDCGAGLSRACVLEQAGAVEEWTAGGLHAPQVPGNAEATECGIMVHITSDGFVYDEELTDPNQGIYNCSPDNVITLEGDYGVAPPEE